MPFQPNTERMRALMPAPYLPGDFAAPPGADPHIEQASGANADLLVQDVLDQMRAEAVNPSATDLAVVPTLDEQVLTEDDALPLPTPDEAKRAMAALYGSEFPLLRDGDAPDEAWADWARALWQRHSSAVQKRLHLAERNRLFRKGVQWISSQGLGPWREPPKPRDAARVVDNMIAPALDQRVQLIREQRPGFRTRPATTDPDDVRKAEAQQVALEYQWDQQAMEYVVTEAKYWAGTDGVAFIEMYWDPDAGPWHEVGEGHSVPLGDVQPRVLRVEQVRVSANATATRKPHYVVIHEVIPAAEAVVEYGPGVLDKADEGRGGHSDGMANTPGVRLGYLLPDQDERLSEQETVSRYTVYCEPSEFLPQGCQVITIGRTLVQGPMPLTAGVIPVVRFADGSPDPSYYAEPEMDGWIDAQMRQNALWSKFIDGIRKGAGTQLLARENAIAGETLMGGNLNLISVKGAQQSLNDIVKELGPFSMSSDMKEALERNNARFEQLSGWNDVSRGSFSTDQSGRSILAQREQLERTFAPSIRAAARAMTDWGKITLAFMRWGYELPRTVAVEGKGRPDLARELSADDFDGVADVWIDAETLMPMPRALRLHILDDMLAKGLLSPEEYRRRSPFAFVQNIETPDLDHFARAKRVVEAIKQSGNPMALPILWQDNEAIHQDALERDILLDDELDDRIRAAAHERWMMLAQQAAMKAGPMPGAMPGAPGGGGEGAPIDPTQQPTFGSNPPIAAAPLSLIGSDEQQAGQAFDARTQR